MSDLTVQRRVHVRYDGNTYDYLNENLDMPETPTDTQVIRAVEIALSDQLHNQINLQGYMVDRDGEVNGLTNIVPQAKFGSNKDCSIPVEGFLLRSENCTLARGEDGTMHLSKNPKKIFTARDGEVFHSMVEYERHEEQLNWLENKAIPVNDFIVQILTRDINSLEIKNIFCASFESKSDLYEMLTVFEIEKNEFEFLSEEETEFVPNSYYIVMLLDSPNKLSILINFEELYNNIANQKEKNSGK